MKKSCLLTFFLITILGLNAQVKDLMIKNGSKGVYLEHVVEAKEGLFSIGRLYNVHPRSIASFNGIDYNKGLSVGQVLNIPLTDTNFSQKAQQGMPVYYIVAEKEGLYRVSQNANKIPLETLRQLNGLKNDNIQAGAKLIVGYLISGEGMNLTAVKEENSIIASSEKKEEPLPVVNKETEKKETQVEEKPTPKNPAPAVLEVSQKPSQQGYFRTFYEQQVRQKPAATEKTVTSGIFKTISGWQDGKYYLLIDNVEPGTIVKITNPGNGKLVYAKVLGQMEGISLNTGLNIRISNSAASILDIPENETEKFIVQVNY